MYRLYNNRPTWELYWVILSGLFSFSLYTWVIRDYELTHGRETDLSTIGVNHWDLEKWCKNTKNLMGINGYPPLWNTLLLACRAYNNSFRSSCRTGDFERALARGHVVGVYGCLLFSSTCHVDLGSHGAFVCYYIVYYIYIYIIYFPWFPSHNTCSLLVRYPKCCFLSRVQGQNLSFCFISPLHLFLLVSRVCCS